MSKNLLEILENDDAVTSLLMKRGNFCVDDSIGISLLVASAFNKEKKSILLLTSSLYSAQRIADFMSSLVGEENILLFPADDVLRCELVTSSKEFLAQRLFVLNEALKKEKKIVIAHASSVLLPLVSINQFKNSVFKINVGDQINIDELKRKLVEYGYLLVPKIDQSLEVASRGDILDIFPVNYTSPIRIELFGDEVESIHYFDIGSQSSNDALDCVEIIPANDCLFTEEEISKFRKNIDEQLIKDKELLDDEAYSLLKQTVELDYEKISSHLFHPRSYKYFQYIKRDIATLIDYVDPELLIVNNDKQFKTSCDLTLSESSEYFNSLVKEGKLLSHQEMYLKVDRVLKNHDIIKTRPFYENSKDIHFNIHPIVFSKTTLSNLDIIVNSYLESNKKTVIALASKQQIEAVTNLLKEENIDYEYLEGLSIPTKKLGITLFPLVEGFELPEYKYAFISSKELFGYQSKGATYLNRFKEGTIIKNFEELKPGDYVVHEQYGIGRYLDVKTLEFDGKHTDYLHIQYAGTNVIYIPLSQFRMVRKYAGREGAAPKLSNPNGKEWEKTKKHIKERVNELADRLFKLYSERATQEGFAFSKDDEFQNQFESEFPFELTKDQDQAVKEIKKDMESPHAMDRLLCGDVGFGKTEVAFRAAFKAIENGKQVAILCPTTLLAKQHYERAKERFSGYGVKIAIISRLVPESEQKDYMKRIASGEIHLVIGTHRLLSKDFSFKDLGLLIVDEEQRFGVEQKERIKELKTNVDVLSLSATPIPRTLQLSLIGVRPVSQIQTAPNNRSTIQTYVAPFNFAVAKELMERELSRKGQVFYVYNVVSSIYHVAEKIQRAIPSARVGVVHGQMNKDDIDDVMERFYSGEIDILVATSIIENGIDVQNANLMIIEDADKFGLAQLYQIKGRVGRGNRIAYAYLFYREGKTLNKSAEKRLKAIQDFAELGSGYKIAQRDLMIRGAGDILGPEQAGFIDSIGLDLYLKLLNEVIEEKKTGVASEPPRPVKMFSVDAYIPDSYASSEDKIELYQEIDSAKDEKQLKDISRKMRDIYGRLPGEVKLLLQSKKIDILLSKEEFDSANEYSDCIEIKLSKSFSNINGIGASLFEILEPYIDKVKLTYIQKVLKLRLAKEDNWILDLEVILECIDELYKKAKK